jgi:HAD superfamily hydrolase (TIGR01549 family)
MHRDSLRPFTARLQAVRAVVFDFYGTLVLDDIVVPAVWQHLNALGYASSHELQRMFEPDAFDGSLTPHFHGDPGHDAWCRENWRQLVALSGVPDPEVDGVLDTVLHAQEQYSARLAPAALELLKLLRGRGFKLGLCSNWESPIKPLLDKLGLSPSLFDAITISAEIGARKPHLAMFHDICNKLQARPSQVMFVGDNWQSDIAGALRAGLFPVWLTHARPTKRLTHLVPEFDSLAAFSACAASWPAVGD